jgi:hypothetical protein
MPIEKSNNLIGNRTRDLPAFSIVPPPPSPTITAPSHVFLRVREIKNELNASAVTSNANV